MCQWNCLNYVVMTAGHATNLSNFSLGATAVLQAHIINKTIKKFYAKLLAQNIKPVDFNAF